MTSNSSLLRLNVGFIVHQNIGYSREFVFDTPYIRLPPDVNLADLGGAWHVSRAPPRVCWCVVEMAYESNYTKDEIKQYTQKISNDYKQKGFHGEIEAALPYDQGWRSGYFTDVGDNVSMFDETDSGVNFNSQQTFSGFRIYVLPLLVEKIAIMTVFIIV